MKTRRSSAPLLLLALGAMACGETGDPASPMLETSPARAPAAGVSSATGSGHVFRPDGSIRKFTISAVQHTDGSVSGQYDLKLGPLQILKDLGERPPVLSFHGTITCMTVDGNRAYLGGVVDAQKNGALFFGRDDFTGVAIELVDNGHGAAAAPDEISSVFVYFPETPSTPQDYCDAPAPGPVFPIDAGSITVR